MQKYFYTITRCWVQENSLVQCPVKRAMAPAGTGFLITLIGDNFFLLAITLVKRW